MSITLKVLSAKKVIANHHINSGEVLVIDARANSNYQLIDDATGFAPQNIIAKREGKDLKIFLEDGNMNADIVIQGYYGDEQNEEVSNLIVGQHENGGIYAYVPESGEKVDAVSMLVDEAAAPQALGGEELSSAFWVFNPWWLLALLPIAGIAIAASGGGSGGSSGSSNASTSTGDNSPVVDTDAPTAPDIEAKDDGSVVVTPKDDSNKTTVDYTDEDGKPSKVVAEKDPETGKWEIKEKPEGSNPTINPDTGVITIPEEDINGGTDVTAKTEDPSGNESDPTTEKAKDTDAPTAPDVEAKDDGSVVVTPKDDSNKTTVDYTDEDGKPSKVVAEKDPETGKWEIKEKPEG
ncbi:cell wall anchor protein, partial [Pelistega sp. NLN82]